MDKLMEGKPRKGNEHASADRESRVKHDGVIEENPQRTQKRALNEESIKRTSLQWSWELESRLLHYLADATHEAHRDVDRSEVVAEALDEFLKKRSH